MGRGSLNNAGEASAIRVTNSRAEGATNTDILYGDVGSRNQNTTIERPPEIATAIKDLNLLQLRVFKAVVIAATNTMGKRERGQSQIEHRIGERTRRTGGEITQPELHQTLESLQALGLVELLSDLEDYNFAKWKISDNGDSYASNHAEKLNLLLGLETDPISVTHSLGVFE